MPRIVDRTGKKYNRLTAVKYVGKSRWLCLCECGNYTVVDGTQLKNGKTKSCGCLYNETRTTASRLDLIGKRFGMLVVKEYVGESRWRCVCDCGNEKVVKTPYLTSGDTRSCGCLAHKGNRRTHGGTGTRLYKVWNGMRERCTCPNNKAWQQYGGRGIKVCDEWLDFETFREWAIAAGYDENAPRGECTIDRIDPDGDYCPENCRWVDASTQMKNRRPFKNPKLCKPVVLIDGDGETDSYFASITDAAKTTGCSITGIVNTCRGKQAKTRGMAWRYASADEMLQASSTEVGEADV